MDNVTKTSLSAILFGAWPLLMARSGLGGNVASFAMACMGILICGIAIAIQGGGDLSEVKWHWAACASLCSVIGVLMFNSMLATAKKEDVAVLFVLNLVIQVVIPAIYHVIVNDWKVPAIRLAGFALAIGSAILLTMKIPEKP